MDERGEKREGKWVVRASIVADCKRADVYVELRETRRENPAGVP